MKPSPLDGLFFVIYAVASVLAETPTSGNNVDTSGENNSTIKDTKMLVYRAVFKEKRAQQVVAAESILKLADYSKQYKMVEIVLEKLFKVLQDARVKVTESGYIPGQAFPTEQAQLDALANVLENTALFGDILLRLPGITHEVKQTVRLYFKVLKALGAICQLKVYERSIFSNMMAQELRLVPRDPNYINPYRKKAKKEQKNKENSEQESISKKSKKKKEKKKRGPRLSHAEL
ncbi:unnamed protein product [Porites evermanni]|uniref:Uncharacterized protein n=1 Tax=Porites evermanni TaxID=104178 RepID=A0ABN8LL70_9CNID|nr:unnamed protein product [Porites evermanni]